MSIKKLWRFAATFFDDGTRSTQFKHIKIPRKPALTTFAQHCRHPSSRRTQENVPAERATTATAGTLSRDSCLVDAQNARRLRWWRLPGTKTRRMRTPPFVHSTQSMSLSSQ